MDLFEVDLFKNEDNKQMDTTVKAKIDKLKAFAEVDDAEQTLIQSEALSEEKEDIKLDFDVDFEALDKINSSEEVEPMLKQTNPQKKNKQVKSEMPEPHVAEKVVTADAGTDTEKLDKALDKLDEYGDKAVSIIIANAKKAAKQFVHYVPIFLSNYQDRKIHKKFENGDLVCAEDFQYLMYQGELMVYKYVGVSQHILIPDYVGNLPVRYIYKGFLNKNIFDNHKVRTVLSYFKDENVSDLSIDSLKDSISGAKSIQLPKELVYLPRNMFSGIKNLNYLIIPSSVRLLSPSAFSKSSITKVYFKGDVPKNLRLLDLPDQFELYCNKQFEENYSEELNKMEVA